MYRPTLHLATGMNAQQRKTWTLRRAEMDGLVVETDHPADQLLGLLQRMNCAVYRSVWNDVGNKTVGCVVAVIGEDAEAFQAYADAFFAESSQDAQGKGNG